MGQQEWTGAFTERSSDAFADAFADDIVLEATALRAPIHGRDNVALVMGTASKLYESLTFTHEAANGPRSYVEWEAVMPGVEPLSGCTILVRDESGKIVRALIHHRPLDRLLAFSAKMGELLADSPIDPDVFYRPASTSD